MAAPAGPCEWCGGPQNWTIIAGEMYVRCVGGCLGLFEEEGSIPSRSEWPEKAWVFGDGTSEKEGVVPLEGPEASTGEIGNSEPPAGWLSSLWEGRLSDG